MQYNVYRVWFEPASGGEACCVAVSAMTEERALELAKEQVKCFPTLQNAQHQIMRFDTSTEHASIC